MKYFKLLCFRDLKVENLLLDQYKNIKIIGINCFAIISQLSLINFIRISQLDVT